MSILLSSGNQAESLEKTLCTILDQDNIGVECVVVDAASSDGTDEILQTHKAHVSLVRQGGLHDPIEALNAGFAQTTGEVIGWLQAGEMLSPWCVKTVATVFMHCPQIDWITSSTPIIWTQSGMCVRQGYADGFSRRTFLAGRNFAGCNYYHHPIHRESTFWRRSLWKRAGNCVKHTIEDAGDYELWSRFWGSAELVCLGVPLAGPQSHLDQPDSRKSVSYWDAALALMREGGWRGSPSRGAIRLRTMIMRRLPALTSLVADAALHIEITPETDNCKVVPKYIV